MGAPPYVPSEPAVEVRTYDSPPRRPRPWRADRPGDLTGRQPLGDRLGVPGPDPGYALALAGRFTDSLQLHRGEDPNDAIAGAVRVALKRSGLFGRAPISADVEIGLTLWGYLDANVDEELVALRRDWFTQVHTRPYYMERRRIADAAPADLLCRSTDEIKACYEDDWRSCLDLTA